MARLLRPVSILMRLDFPTLERPMNAYSGNVPVGHFFTSVLLIINSALVMFIVMSEFRIGRVGQESGQNTYGNDTISSPHFVQR